MSNTTSTKTRSRTRCAELTAAANAGKIFDFNDAAVDESPDQWTYAFLNDQLSKDQHGKCDQKSYVRLDVVEKRDFNGRPADGVTLHNGQQQQREPRDKHKQYGLAI